MKCSTLFHAVFATAITVSLFGLVPAHQGTKMDPNAKTMTIEGIVRDLACPAQNPAGTATNVDLKCVRDCVRHGSPVIILTKDGFIYFPISADMPDSGQHKKMMPFVGKYVQATGAVFERKGTRTIAITQIKELKNIPLDATSAD
ncbi:MAG TPA: hypothetical protein VFF39_09820 [Verrucomicrobiae bacterium]|nr:hypothetical protein [Verrucomicrobiae bacterium]